MLTLAELETRGAAYLEKNPDLIKERVGAITKDQLATLIYTSGTTGRPKGVRLPHDNWSYMAKAIAATGLVSREDVQYLWLPLAHVFGKVLTSGQIEVGHVTAVDGRVDKIIENLPVVQPTYMAAVPAHLREGLQRGRGQGPGGRRRQVQDLPVGRRGRPRVRQGHARTTSGAPAPPPRPSASPPSTRSPTRWSTPRSARPSAASCAPVSPAPPPSPPRSATSSPAPASTSWRATASPSPRAASFVNPGEAYRTGTVGKPLPGTEVRIADDGEILLRGPGIMEGYHGLPEKTAEVLEADGWFHTGDIGELSPDGYLRITDRKKDLIKTSGGKYIAPAEVEGQFKAVCPYVSNILVHGADRNFCTALIALDEPSILGWAEENGLDGQVVRGGRRRARDGRA